jgi:hypothetical protein
MSQVFSGNVGALASAPIFPGLRTCFDAAFHELNLAVVMLAPAVNTASELVDVPILSANVCRKRSLLVPAKEDNHMDPTARLEPIPRPPGHLLIGNLLDLDAGHPIESLMDLARQYGPIYELTIPSRGSRIIVSGTSWSTSCVTNPASISWWDQA